MHRMVTCKLLTRRTKLQVVALEEPLACMARAMCHAAKQTQEYNAHIALGNDLQHRNSPLLSPAVGAGQSPVCWCDQNLTDTGRKCHQVLQQNRGD